MSRLCLILGDQLSTNLSSLKHLNKDTDYILMAEVQQEASYVPHHKKKIAFIFSAMRHFHQQITQQGYHCEYIEYSQRVPSLLEAIKRTLAKIDIDEIVITEPGEYRVLQDIKSWQHILKQPIEILPDDRFIASHDEFSEWVNSRNTITMEYWYREMRKKTGLLMNGNKPVGEQWNFDKENRKSLKKGISIPQPLKFKPDALTRSVLKLVGTEFSEHFGDVEPFWYAVTREQAEQVLQYFLQHQLSNFGDYQDAMQDSEPFIFHSVVSHYINIGLLDALEVCRRVEQCYLAGDVPLNAAEGYIRQIIGWREYMRGIYWHFMPEYGEKNAMQATQPLPDFYWSANTRMNCIAKVVAMTKEHAYSHHIQRLMVTGNFANLAGLDVQQVCDWYLAVYADAYEWVELPNTLGMALYADGGIVGSKPYISGGAYINRMSNFCKSCAYDHKQRLGEDACPFTKLYWNYLITHRAKLQNNRRMSLAYRNLDRMPAEEQNAIQEQAQDFIHKLND